MNRLLIALLALCSGVTLGAQGEQSLPYARLGTITSAPAKSLGNKDFTAYRWETFPSVVVIDFKSYQVQDRYLKRMVFFVEKKGFRGTLLTNAQINGRHGWNANDFSASSLAAFYNRVVETHFSLNKEEIELKTLLVSWGLLVADPKKQDISSVRVTEGKGALLSIAQVGGANLRAMLLQHEACHGVYFTNQGYYDFVHQVWSILSDDARRYLVLFFSSMNYDPDDAELMINEFHAYMLQNPENELKGHLTGSYVNSYESYTGGKSDLRKLAPIVVKELYQAAGYLKDYMWQTFAEDAFALQ